MDNFLRALCRTIWWTLLPPAEPKCFIILQSFPRGSSSEAAVTQRGWMFPLVLSFFFFLSFLVHVLSSTWDCWVLWVESCFRTRQITSSWPSTSLVTFSVTPKRPGEAMYFLSHLFIIRPQKAPSGWISLVHGVLRNPPRITHSPPKSFHS